jgi:GNAT superfamily N-acetyltransferase
MSAINIRPATLDDLPAINRVIEAAVMTWDLPERVKRLSLPSYRYDAFDFDHLQIVVADDASGQLVGLASWEAADPRDCPADRNGLLLHGLYVDPAAQRAGVGSALLHAALAAVSERGCDGLLVKAQADAVGFFMARGLEPLPVEDHARHYANRFWKAMH